MFFAFYVKNSWIKVFSYGTAYLIAVLFIRYAENICWARVFSTRLNASSVKLIKPPCLYKYLKFAIAINIYNDIYLVVCINEAINSLFEHFFIIPNIILVLIVSFCTEFLLFFYPKLDDLSNKSFLMSYPCTFLTYNYYST